MKPDFQTSDGNASGALTCFMGFLNGVLIFIKCLEHKVRVVLARGITGIARNVSTCAVTKLFSWGIQ